MKKANGFDQAILGVGQRAGHDDILVYDRDKCIEILRDEMSHEEALDFFDYNVLGAWVGAETPIFVSCADTGLDGIPPDD
tara:strand:+ start:103 stop:342 length:240 start_codon:yes stop_codon:yes gene_type:complete